MSDYRIKEIWCNTTEKYFKVERRMFLFFWEHQGHFDTLKQAQASIQQFRDDNNRPTDTIVHKE